MHRIIKYNQKTWLKPYEHKFTKKSKKWFPKSWWIMEFSKKLWKMWGSIGTLNLEQQKKEETIWYQNQSISCKNFFFFWKSINTNEKKKQIPMNKLVLLGFLIL